MKTSLFAFASSSRMGGRARSLTTTRPRTVAKKTGKSSIGGRKPPSNRRKPTKLKPAGERRRINIDFDMIHKLVVDLNKKRSLKKAGKEASRETINPVGGLTHGDEITIQSEGSKTTEPNTIGQGVIVKNKNEMVTGSPTVKSIKMLEKISGKITRVMWDSKLYGALASNYSLVERRQLLHEHGFNTKKWWVMPGCAAPGYLDILDAILNNQTATPQQAKTAIALYVDGRTSSISDERKYASVENFKVEMCFTNESNYLPVKLKLMYIMPKNDVRKQNDLDTAATRAGYMWDWQNFVMNQDGNYTQQRDNAIPVRYQLSGPDVQGVPEFQSATSPTGPLIPQSDNYRNCSIGFQVAVKAKPQMSAYFRDNFDIVRTFTRTLDPNDVWNFKHTHHFGKGLEIDELKQAFVSMNQTRGNAVTSFLRVGNDRPLVGYWVVESMGVPCTCLVGDREITASAGVVFQNPYAGTSSGSYHCEIKSTLTYVAPLVTASSGAVTTTAGAVENVHMRVFKKRDFVLLDSRNVRHVLPENMVTDKDDLLEDKGMITVYSDASVQAAGDKDYKS